MRGGLRWPCRPFQVTCVLVAVLLTAAFSLMLSLAKYAEDQPIPDEPTPSRLSHDRLGRDSLGGDGVGERLNAKTIAIIFGNPKAASTRRGGERVETRPAVTGAVSIGCASADEKITASDQSAIAGAWQQGEATNEVFSSPS